jgi:DNA-directed RNA polymerase beta subunit
MLECNRFCNYESCTSTYTINHYYWIKILQTFEFQVGLSVFMSQINIYSVNSLKKRLISSTLIKMHILID